MATSGEDIHLFESPVLSVFQWLYTRGCLPALGWIILYGLLMMVWYWAFTLGFIILQLINLRNLFQCCLFPNTGQLFKYDLIQKRLLPRGTVIKDLTYWHTNFNELFPRLAAEGYCMCLACKVIYRLKMMSSTERQRAFFVLIGLCLAVCVSPSLPLSLLYGSIASARTTWLMTKAGVVWLLSSSIINCLKYILLTKMSVGGVVMTGKNIVNRIYGCRLRKEAFNMLETRGLTIDGNSYLFPLMEQTLFHMDLTECTVCTCVTLSAALVFCTHTYPSFMGEPSSFEYWYSWATVGWLETIFSSLALLVIGYLPIISVYSVQVERDMEVAINMIMNHQAQINHYSSPSEMRAMARAMVAAISEGFPETERYEGKVGPRMSRWAFFQYFWFTIIRPVILTVFWSLLLTTHLWAPLMNYSFGGGEWGVEGGPGLRICRRGGTGWADAFTPQPPHVLTAAANVLNISCPMTTSERVQYNTYLYNTFWGLGYEDGDEMSTGGLEGASSKQEEKTVSEKQSKKKIEEVFKEPEVVLSDGMKLREERAMREAAEVAAAKEADRKEKEAVQKKKEADKKKGEADKKQKEASKKQKEAEKKKREADMKQKEASEKQMEGDKKQKEASKSSKEAGKKQKEADKKQKEASKSSKEAGKKQKEGDTKQKEANENNKEAGKKQMEGDKKQKEASKKGKEASEKQKEGGKKQWEPKKQMEASEKKREADKKEKEAASSAPVPIIPKEMPFKKADLTVLEIPFWVSETLKERIVRRLGEVAPPGTDRDTLVLGFLSAIKGQNDILMALPDCDCFAEYLVEPPLLNWLGPDDDCGDGGASGYWGDCISAFAACRACETTDCGPCEETPPCEPCVVCEDIPACEECDDCEYESGYGACDGSAVCRECEACYAHEAGACGPCKTPAACDQCEECQDSAPCKAAIACKHTIACKEISGCVTLCDAQARNALLLTAVACRMNSSCEVGWITVMDVINGDDSFEEYYKDLQGDVGIISYKLCELFSRVVMSLVHKCFKTGPVLFELLIFAFKMRVVMFELLVLWAAWYLYRWRHGLSIYFPTYGWLSNRFSKKRGASDTTTPVAQPLSSSKETQSMSSSTNAESITSGNGAPTGSQSRAVPQGKKKGGGSGGGMKGAAGNKLLAEAYRLEAKAEKVRVAAELATAKAAAKRLEATEQAAAKKLAAEKAAAKKMEAEKAAAEKLEETEQATAEKLAAEKLKAEKAAAEKLAAEKLEAEKAAAKKLEAIEQAAASKLAAEKAAAKKLEAEKVAAKRLAAEEADAKELAVMQAAVKKLQAKQAAAQKLAAQEASRDEDEHVVELLTSAETKAGKSSRKKKASSRKEATQEDLDPTRAKGFVPDDMDESAWMAAATVVDKKKQKKAPPAPPSAIPPYASPDGAYSSTAYAHIPPPPPPPPRLPPAPSSSAALFSLFSTAAQKLDINVPASPFTPSLIRSPISREETMAKRPPRAVSAAPLSGPPRAPAWTGTPSAGPPAPPPPPPGKPTPPTATANTAQLPHPVSSTTITPPAADSQNTGGGDQNAGGSDQNTTNTDAAELNTSTDSDDAKLNTSAAAPAPASASTPTPPHAPPAAAAAAAAELNTSAAAPTRASAPTPTRAPASTPPPATAPPPAPVIAPTPTPAPPTATSNFAAATNYLFSFNPALANALQHKAAVPAPAGPVASAAPSKLKQTSSQMCVKCHEAPKKVACVHATTAHLSLCSTCAEDLKVGNPCPVCSTPIDRWISVYLNC